MLFFERFYAKNWVTGLCQPQYKVFYGNCSEQAEALAAEAVRT